MTTRSAPLSATSSAASSTRSVIASRSRSELPVSFSRVTCSDTPGGSMAWNWGSAAWLPEGSSMPMRARVP